MNEEQKAAFDLYACLVCAIENAEGRVPEGLTEGWLANAKAAVTRHEKAVGANGCIYEI